jgi:peroxisomal membrane protein 4
MDNLPSSSSNNSSSNSSVMSTSSIFSLLNYIQNSCKSDMCDHENCLISSFRGLRNGIYYGGKIRFVHSLVMTILFKQGHLKDKIKSIISLTWEHAFNLGMFVFIYKTIVCILRRVFRTKNKIINFIAGVVGSYFMWTKKTAVNQQIMLYLLSRNLLAFANLFAEKYCPKFNYGFPIASMLVWGVVMFLFEYKPKSLQSSLYSSMDFIYKESNKLHSWKDFIPFYIPNYIISTK